MGQQKISLGRILGIPIGLDYSWFLVFILLTWTLAVSYYPTEFKNWPVVEYWLVGAVTAKLQLQALDQAIADAQTHADQLAKSSGVQRGEVLSMSEVISPAPIPRPGLMAAQVESPAVPIQPGSSKIHAQVQVVYAIQ